MNQILHTLGFTSLTNFLNHHDIYYTNTEFTSTIFIKQIEKHIQQYNYNNLTVNEIIDTAVKYLLKDNKKNILTQGYTINNRYNNYNKYNKYTISHNNNIDNKQSKYNKYNNNNIDNTIINNKYHSNNSNIDNINIIVNYPNSSTNRFKTKKWSHFFKSIPNNFAIFLLTSCNIIEKDINYVLLAGNIDNTKKYNKIINKNNNDINDNSKSNKTDKINNNNTYNNTDLTDPTHPTTNNTTINKNNYTLDRKVLWKKKIFYKKLNVIDFINKECKCKPFMKNKINKFINKFERLNINDIFNSYFSNQDINNKYDGKNDSKDIGSRYDDISDKYDINNINNNTNINNKDHININININNTINTANNKIIDFIFLISKKILNNIIDYKNFIILKSKIKLLITKNKYEDITISELINYFKINKFKIFYNNENSKKYNDSNKQYNDSSKEYNNDNNDSNKEYNNNTTTTNNNHTVKNKCNRIEYINRYNFILYFINALFTKIYIPLISHFFYTTEITKSKYKLYYIQRDVWYKYEKEKIEEYLKNNYTIEDNNGNRYNNGNSGNNINGDRNENKIKYIIPSFFQSSEYNNNNHTTTNHTNHINHINNINTTNINKNLPTIRLIPKDINNIDKYRIIVNMKNNNIQYNNNSLRDIHSILSHILNKRKDIILSYKELLHNLYSINDNCNNSNRNYNCNDDNNCNISNSDNKCDRDNKESDKSDMKYNNNTYNIITNTINTNITNITNIITTPKNKYILKLDIKNCYDNIPVDTLLYLIPKILSKNKYSIKKYSMIELLYNKLIIKHKSIISNRSIFDLDINNNYNSSYSKVDDKRYYNSNDINNSTYNSNTYNTTNNITNTTNTTNNNNNHKIICDNIYTKEIYLQSIISSIRNMLLENRIYYRNNTYIQNRGIPQGSILSTLLCNLYYSYIHNKYFKKIFISGSIIRYVDDYIIVTDNIEEIKTFFQCIKTLDGFIVNYNKIESNFNIDDILCNNDNRYDSVSDNECDSKCNNDSKDNGITNISTNNNNNIITTNNNTIITNNISYDYNYNPYKYIKYCGILINSYGYKIYNDYNAIPYSIAHKNIDYNINLYYKCNKMIRRKIHPLFFNYKRYYNKINNNNDKIDSKIDNSNNNISYNNNNTNNNNNIYNLYLFYYKKLYYSITRSIFINNKFIKRLISLPDRYLYSISISKRKIKYIKYKALEDSYLLFYLKEKELYKEYNR